MKVQDFLGDRLGTEVFMYSISIDPENDTPEVLGRYRTDYGIRDGWTFLTGDFDEIEKIRRAFGVYDPDPVVDKDKTQHSGLIVMGYEPRGTWSAQPALGRPEIIFRALWKLVKLQEDQR